VALWTGRPTYTADPYKESLVDLTPLARRKLAIIAARLDDATRAERFGVIVGLKEGQMKKGMVDVIASKLEERGKKVLRLALRELSPERLRYFDGIGVLVYNGLIDVNLVRDMMGPSIISVWEKFETIIKRRRTDINWPDMWMPFEYLYNRVIEEKRTFEI